MTDIPIEKQGQLSATLRTALANLQEVEEVLVDLPRDKRQLIYDLIVNLDQLEQKQK